MGLLFGFSPTQIFNHCMAGYFKFLGLQSRLVELDNGTTMHCWMPQTQGCATKRTGAKAGAGAVSAKPPLVLLHAFGLDAYTWGRQISTFSKTFDLYVPDLLFSGHSITTNKERTEFFQAECVLKLLQQLDVFKFSVVGTSYGGFVAYRIAHMYPHAVHKLVLSSSAVNMTPSTDKAMVRRFRTKDVIEILQPHDVEGVRRTSILAFHRQPPFTIPAFLCHDLLDVIFNKNRKEKLELLDGLQLRKPNAPPLPKVDQEVLVIWGESDPVFDVSYAHQLKEYIGENAELEIIEDAAHVPQVEIPGQYNQKVMKFLTRLPRATQSSR